MHKQSLAIHSQADAAMSGRETATLPCKRYGHVTDDIKEKTVIGFSDSVFFRASIKSFVRLYSLHKLPIRQGCEHVAVSVLEVVV